MLIIMINIKEIRELLSQAGLFPIILVVGGWIYFVILLIVFLYNLIFGSSMVNQRDTDKKK